MARAARLNGLVLALILTITCTSCVGPSPLRRGVDEWRNQMYVDSPIIAQTMAPAYLVADVGASIADAVFINPVHWWKDALAGTGTPYYFRDPVVPDGDSQ